MRYIGSKLKQLRHDLGLTQTEMAAGVISVSFYSKVERGYHDIGAEELIEILQKHNISFQEFFSGISKEDANNKRVNILLRKFVKAANVDDDTEINNIISEIENIKPRTPFVKSEILLTKLIANTHDEDALRKLNEKEKREIKKIIFQEDTDENEYIRIAMIANTIRVYSFDEASFLISSIIRRYKDVDKIEGKLLLAISAAMTNFINWCFENGKANLCVKAIKYLKALPNTVELAFTKILVEYYESLIKGKFDDVKLIRNLFTRAGYGTFVNKMVDKYNKP
ncbi:helix-turn-helix domain-containing protein [Lactobacillus panisapium]|uniref:Helix-turn-helix transcriptional regulator n=1 Tax=Lactobacillus panisapium TaxID=2012495 RepID=A0ABX8W7I6_9LACO|nr:helix-turn-helix transcriptional regulator [Lactobacillus panisapium]QYN53452.1 helix-turn-helix transcriptional regulator [Lactobacillus panisapium]QYN59206.1 helix-turn-helix transcriptional regulator [Lactobacillus panisapium]